MNVSNVVPFVILLIVTLNPIKSATSSNKQFEEDNIAWPQAYDEFDEHLINLARSKRQASLDEDEEVLITTTTQATVTKANTTAKNYTIDWNEVEANWVKTISEKEVAEKWNKMETSLKNGVRSILRTVFPQIVSMSSDAKVSGNCSAGILKWIISLRHLKGWAIKMLDAIGKPPSGLLEGAITMFGNHHQCLDIRAPDDEDDFDEDDENAIRPKFKEFFRGQYCSLELKPWLPPKPHYYGFANKIKSLERDVNDDGLFAELAQYAIFLHLGSFRVDLCVPSICQREDLQRVANFLAKLVDFKAKVTKCEIQSDSFVDLSVTQTVALVLMVGAITLIIVASLIVKLYPRVRALSKGRDPPGLLKYLSLSRSWEEICGLEQYQRKPKLATLYGFRFLIILWILMVNTVSILNYQFLRDMLPLKDLILSQSLQIATNSSLQYSTLFFLSAFIFAYYNESRGTWKAVKHVLAKYFRIVPIVIVGMVFIMLLPMADIGLIKGPVWGDYVNNVTLNCQANWWRNLFFIQNFFHPKETCLMETWIFCVEMQLAAFFVLVFALLANMKKAATWFVLGFLVILGFIANALTVYTYDLPPTWIWTLPDVEQRDAYFQLHLFKPWTHLSVYAIGIGAGLFCADRKKGFSGGPYGKGVTSLIGWTSIAIAAGAIIFAPHEWILGNLPDETFSAIYDGAHRIIWALVHSILLFLITVDIDQEDVGSSFLGNKVMISFGRLSLVAMVINPVVQIFFFASQQSNMFSGVTVWVYVILCNLMLTYLLSFLVSLFVEMPTAAIFKSRESTRARKEFEMPKFNKPTTFAVGSNARNGNVGDIELSKSKDHHQVRL